MEHSQDYDVLNTMFVVYTSLPFQVIKKTMAYTGNKNYRTIYRQCIDEVVDIINDTGFLYHIEQMFDREFAVHQLEDNKNKRRFRVVRHQQTTEYMKRYTINDDNKNLTPIELIFYFALEGIEISHITQEDLFYMDFVYPTKI